MNGEARKKETDSHAPLDASATEVGVEALGSLIVQGDGRAKDGDRSGGGTPGGERTDRRDLLRKVGLAAAGTAGLLGTGLAGTADAATKHPAYTNVANTFTAGPQTIKPRNSAHDALILSPDENGTGKALSFGYWHTPGGRNPPPPSYIEAGYIDSTGFVSFGQRQFAAPTGAPTLGPRQGSASTISRSDHNHGFGWGIPYYAAAAQDDLVFESYSLINGSVTDMGVMTSDGVMSFWNVPVIGTKIRKIRFWSGDTAAIGITHMWVATYDGLALGLAGSLLEQSPDMGTIAWPANTPMDFTLPAATDNVGTVGLMIVATQHPSLMGKAIFHATNPDDTFHDDWWSTGTVTGLTDTAPRSETGNAPLDKLAYVRVSTNVYAV